MPRRCLRASVVFVLLLSALLVPATIYGTPANHLLIAEVMYDPAAAEPGAEWIELFNPTGSAQSLAGWSLRDNSAADSLPDYTLEPGQYVVVAANRDEFLAANPGYGGPLLALGSPIGNGLSNSDDSVALIDAAGATVDGLSYGNDASQLNPPCPDAPEGQALARYPADSDTDSAADWLVAVPTPGGATPPPTPAPTATDTPTITPSAAPTGTPSRTPTSTMTATPTATPLDPDETPTPTATAEPWPALLLSEVYYDAPQTGSEGKYEWVEVFNPTDATISIKGWKVADNSSADALPDAIVPAGGYLVVAATRDGFAANFPLFSGNLVALEGTIGNGLSNSGDRLRLLGPDNSVVDEMSYGDDKTAFDPPCHTVKPGESLARVPGDRDTGSAADWMTQEAPGPGQEGIAPTPTPTTTPTLSPTATRTGAATPTATATFTRTPTRTVTVTGTPTNTRTPSPTPSATPPLGGEWPRVLLSEIMYDPLEEGSDADWEWVELLNPTGENITLEGWTLADTAGRDMLPPITIAAGEYVVLAARGAAFRADYPLFSGHLVSLEGSIGTGLSNTGDSVKLVAPDGSVIDAMSYGSDKSVFDPACRDAQPGQSLGRAEGPDTDTAADWVMQEAPNPGAKSAPPTPTPTATPSVTATPTGSTPTPTPTSTSSPTATPLPEAAFKITLNEVLPDPAAIDWDRDGETSFMDEWIELYNGSDASLSLAGWSVGDDTSAYELPAGTVIWPRSYLLLFRSQTRLSLSDWRDAVTLTRSDGTLADRLVYDRGPGDDRSYCRLPDGSGAWTDNCEVTPGEANRARPAPPPAPPGAANPTATPAKGAARTIMAARAAAVDTRVTVSGTVTFPPGLIDKTIYIQDATGGIRVYLRKGEFPALKVGDRVSVTGWTRDFHGEAEISAPDAGYLTVIGPGKPSTPKLITAKEIGEANEGQLVQVIGTVTKYAPLGLTLKDRGGPIELYFPESLGWRRPYVRIGDLWAAQGVLSQYQSERGEGYRIIPRFKSDVATGPVGLPVTGSASPALLPLDDHASDVVRLLGVADKAR